MRALVTGFEAFGGDTVNASLAALQKLPTHVSGVAITTLELPTSFAPRLRCSRRSARATHCGGT